MNLWGSEKKKLVQENKKQEWGERRIQLKNEARKVLTTRKTNQNNKPKNLDGDMV
ncbi:hypothetical protein ACEU2D_24080 [Brevibacillus laterosporus]|uniref:hypothetical protein n=1 Tax=Brevibacillus laterosporus TaxID=1465 RepID=UPI0035A661BC